MVSTIENEDWDFEVKDYLQSYKYIEPQFSTENGPSLVSQILRFPTTLEQRVNALVERIREKWTTSPNRAIVVGVHVRRGRLLAFFHYCILHSCIRMVECGLDRLLFGFGFGFGSGPRFTYFGFCRVFSFLFFFICFFL